MGDARVSMDVMGNVSPSRRTGNRLHGDDELFIGAIRFRHEDWPGRADRARADTRRR